MVFLIAEVNEALGSLPCLVDHGYRVAFDKDAKTGKELGYMLREPTSRTSRFRRDRNVWVFDVGWIRNNCQPGIQNLKFSTLG